MVHPFRYFDIAIRAKNTGVITIVPMAIVTQDIVSLYCRKLNGSGPSKIDKKNLYQSLYNKSVCPYVLHYENVQFYLIQRLNLQKSFVSLSSLKNFN